MSLSGLYVRYHIVTHLLNLPFSSFLFRACNHVRLHFSRCSASELLKSNGDKGGPPDENHVLSGVALALHSGRTLRVRAPCFGKCGVATPGSARAPSVFRNAFRGVLYYRETRIIFQTRRGFSLFILVVLGSVLRL